MAELHQPAAGKLEGRVDHRHGKCWCVCAVLEKREVVCAKNRGGSCGFSIPSSMGRGSRDSHIFISEMTTASVSACSKALFVLATSQGTVANDEIQLSFPSSALDAANLGDKAISLCWTGGANPLTSSIQVWNTALLGNIIVLDPNVSAGILAGVPPLFVLNVSGLTEAQLTAEGLPKSLRQVYLRDTEMCLPENASTSVALTSKLLRGQEGAMPRFE